MTEDQKKQDVPMAQNPILIMGSGDGLGLAIAKNLAENGRKLILTFHSNPEKVVELQQTFPDQILATLVLDVRSSESIQRFFLRVGELTEALNAVINTVGPILEKPLGKTEAEEFSSLIDTNLSQVFWTSRHALSFLRRDNHGRFIAFTFAGVEKFAAYTRIGTYAVAKAGLLSLIRSLALEWVPYGVTVNAIAPGVIDLENRDQSSYASTVPGGRLGRTDDIVHALRFLLSTEADHITGQNLTVSGGFGLK